MITHLRLKGFKCIVDFDYDLPPFCVLIGRNDSGKSSLLQALDGVARSASAPLRGVSQLAWRGSGVPQIGWELDLRDESLQGTAHYELEMGVAEGTGEDRVLREVLRSNGTTVFSANESGQATDGGGTVIRAKGRTGRTVVCEYSNSPVHPDIVKFANALGSVRPYFLAPEELARPSALNPELGEVQITGKGYGLPSVLAAIKLSDDPRFELIQSGLRQVMRSFRRIVLRPTRVRVPFGFEETEHSGKKADRPLWLDEAGHRLSFLVGEAEWEIPAEQCSGGVLLLLGYLTLASSACPPRVILIEEPENGIHPRGLKEVVRILKHLSEGIEGAKPIQVIMTTHSPYLLDFVKPDEVLIFRKTKVGATTVRRLADAPHLGERLSEQTLGEMWFNIGEEALAKGSVTVEETKKEQ